MRRQLHRDEDRHRTVGAPDDADRSRFVDGEAHQLGEDQRDEDAKVGARAENDEPGIGDHGTEIGHGAHTEEDQRRDDQLRHAFEGVMEQPSFLDHIQQRRYRLSAWNIVRGTGHVDDNAREADADEQQRLIVLRDRQVDHRRTDGDHHHVPESEVDSPGLVKERVQKNRDLLEQLQPTLLQSRRDATPTLLRWLPRSCSAA